MGKVLVEGVVLRRHLKAERRLAGGKAVNSLDAALALAAGEEGGGQLGGLARVQDYLPSVQRRLVATTVERSKEAAL